MMMAYCVCMGTSTCSEPNCPTHVEHLDHETSKKQMDLLALVGNSSAPGTPDDGLPLYVGYIGCVLAAVFFGSNFIPVKKFETGDGVFFQLILCISIWVPSVILNAIRGFPRFWPLAMLGGFIWCTGNMMVVPIIHCVGMAMGILIWGTMNMLVGWASGRFGWFGLTPEVPHNTTLNYLGVVTCLCSAIIVSFIKPNLEDPGQSKPSNQVPVNVNETQPLIPPFSGDPFSINDEVEQHSTSMLPLPDDLYYTKPPAYGAAGDPKEGSSTDHSQSMEESQGENKSIYQKMSPLKRKILGVVMCVISGACYGVNFAPVIYIKDNYPQWYGNCTQDPCLVEPSSKDIDYVFSHFTGILLTSILYFTIYCAIKKNKPVVYPQVMLPALASGIMWSIADISFFLANEVLDESVSFPIINAGPGVVASLWGVFLFREIRGRRNLGFLAIAFCLTSGGCVLCGLSK